MAEDLGQSLCCPGCTEPVEIPSDSAGELVRCPYCSTEFFASSEQSHLPVVDDTDVQSADADRESAFDKLRIENFTALRMGAIRARSWWMIGLVLALVTDLDMIVKTILYVCTLRGWGWWPTLYTAIALLAATFARHARRRAADFKREIDRSAIPEPTTPPDFSTLSDGSERWKHLENVL